MSVSLEHRLRTELLNQWLSNHAEHCGKEADGEAWNPLHEGDCHWPLPPVLGRRWAEAKLASLDPKPVDPGSGAELRREGAEK
jgi:hypothetical protein